MAHRLILISAVLVFLSFNASPVSAGVLDPIPIFNNVPGSDPPESLHSSASTLFLCPQSKDFVNQPDKVVIETLMMEALGEGYKGMVAVGEVIRNRTRLFMKDAEAICLMPKQFSCWNDSEHAENFMEKYRQYYFIALMAWLDSKTSDLTNGATDYHTRSICPSWAHAYHVAARLGSHVFYVRSNLPKKDMNIADLLLGEQDLDAHF